MEGYAIFGKRGKFRALPLMRVGDLEVLENYNKAKVLMEIFFPAVQQPLFETIMLIQDLP